ncbi:MAG: tRNA (adenosine(37)-N6)-dimethylallyltransferase MiaA [Candidatus Omnitrophica bacterium]|nr:tRNA (adenosine(37)-N6)-dimethylallyltransferase MiaA [Candidatus Omnitrophota bacterium]
MKPFVLILVGPTGIGKSKLASKLARKFPVEIISADSMQVYKGLDIGTAKPAATEQRRVKHHLIDMVEPSKSFSGFLFRKKALEAIRQITRRGHIPLVAGGSGLYVRALVRGLTRYPKAKNGLRLKLEKECEKKGLKHLVERLSTLAPERAREIDQSNSRRVIRALEIALAMKNGKSEELPSLEQLGYDYKVFGLTMDREKLYRMVEKRIDAMFRKGWIREARGLLRKRLNRTVKQAIGYRQIWAALTNPEKPARLKLDRVELKVISDSVKLATRHLVKKQFTWYRREPWIEWLDVGTAEGFKSAVQKMSGILRLRHAD